MQGMQQRVRFAARVLLMLTAMAHTPASARAQLVPIRTVPVATGDQFLLQPAINAGMGAQGIALEDSLAAVFSNPAALGRLADGFFYGAPVHYGISQPFGRSLGSGTSIPVGAFFGAGDWTLGGSMALQELSAAESDFGVPVPLWANCPECDFIGPPISQVTLSDASSRNIYMSGRAARRLGASGASVGMSISYADLNWVAGIEHLYAGGQRIDPRGGVFDLRLGALWENHSGTVTEAVLVHNRVDMQHDVTYLEWLPLPTDPDPLRPTPLEPRLRLEENLDVTHTWGGHFRHARAIGTRGWRAGWSLTANRRSHPKIPNYEIQNIPRDPGNSWAFNAGMGLARDFGPVSFGVEAILEPIWAETWQEAEGDTTTAAGAPIESGDKTILNDFQFANVLLKTGVAFRSGATTLQAGLQAHSISYDLEQVNRLEATVRDQTESWIEWAPTWSLSYRFEEATLRYFGHARAGTGQPGVTQNWVFDGVPMAELAADAGSLGILTAPSGPLTLQSATVWTHQFAVIVPIH